MKIIEMYNRHADDIGRVLTEGIRNYADGLYEGTLPISCLIRLVLTEKDTNNLCSTAAQKEIGTQGFKNWAGAPNVILALVFTDMVGSTALGNKLGNKKMLEVRRYHFQQAKSYIKKHKGYLIKTLGDSVMAAFHTADDALAFSLDFYADTGDEKVNIRAGIHVGPVDIDAGDASGSMVNFAHRIVETITGAAIWVSDEAKKHIEQESAARHKKIKWSCEADRNLKGFNGSYILWSVFGTA